MKILALSGSKNHQGKTAQAINAIIKGVDKAGAKSECIFLIDLSLEHCRQCNNDGWGICRTEGYCIIKDDFASVVEKVRAADAVVFASPVYFGDLSESMRMFLDRLRRISFGNRPRPVPGAPPILVPGSTPAIGLCYAGGSGNGTITSSANLERILQTCGFDVVDMIPVRRQNLQVKLPILEIIGKWLATKPTST